MSKLDLITLTDPRSSASEAYRTLRTNLEFTSLEHPLRSLLVTAPAEKADKSVMVANLAVIMAEGGREVILVDGDLRRPALHEVFGLDNGRGLSDLVRHREPAEGHPDLGSYLQQSGVDGLRVLASGPLPQNPSVLLGAPEMGQVIDLLTKQGDLVLFDAPPVLAVTDASLLAARVDGTLLVVRAGGTRREHVQQAKDLLEKVNARLIGAALTNARVDGAFSSYYG